MMWVAFYFFLVDSAVEIKGFGMVVIMKRSFSDFLSCPG